jgi:hypothetical protein
MLGKVMAITRYCWGRKQGREGGAQRMAGEGGVEEQEGEMVELLLSSLVVVVVVVDR